jgi:hypothetical protein
MTGRLRHMILEGFAMLFLFGVLGFGLVAIG